MKRFSSKLLFLVLILPLILAACGGDKVGNAEKFLEAIADGDLDEAEKYVCDDEKDDLEDEAGFASSMEGVSISDISCEEDGDNVSCSMTIGIEGVEGGTETEIVFVMDGDKVCGVPE